MSLLASVLIAVVALEHLYILVMEAFLWTKPRTLKVFGMSREQAEASKALAANMGLYNGFLAAGLVWSLLHPAPEVAHQLALFFLVCVVVAAIVGAATASRRILVVQGLPAALALAAVLLT